MRLEDPSQHSMQCHREGNVPPLLPTHVNRQGMVWARSAGPLALSLANGACLGQGGVSHAGICWYPAAKSGRYSPS